MMSAEAQAERQRLLSPQPGVKFASKQELHMTVRWFNTFLRRQCRVQKSDRTYFKAVCVLAPFRGHRKAKEAARHAHTPWCDFQVYGKREGMHWVVTSSNLTHTCTAEQGAAKSRKASALNMNDVATVMLSSPAIIQNGVQTDVLESLEKEHGLTIPTPRVLRAHHVAINLERGVTDPHGVEQLNPYLAALQATDPDVVSAVDVTGNGPTFQRAFVALGACRRVVASAAGDLLPRFMSVEAAHARQGMLLFLVGADNDGNMLPLAIAVVQEQSVEAWKWFFEHVVKAFPKLVTWENTLSVVCDTFTGSSAGVAASLPRARRFESVNNRQRRIHAKFDGASAENVFELYRRAAEATCLLDYQQAMQMLQKLSPGAHSLLMEWGPEAWASTAIPVRCYGKLVSSDALAFAHLDVLYRARQNSSITKLIGSVLDTIVKMLATRRRQYCQLSKESETPVYNKPFPQATFKALQGDTARASSLTASITDEYDCLVPASGVNGNHAVQLDPKVLASDPFWPNMCSCRLPRVLGRPCCHVIAAAGTLDIDVEKLVAPELSTAAMRQTYSRECMGPSRLPATAGMTSTSLRNPTWRVVLDVEKADYAASRGRTVDDLPPTFSRLAAAVRPRGAASAAASHVVPGRRSKRLRMSGMKYQCSRCHQTGHNVRRCPLNTTQQGVTVEGPAAGVAGMFARTKPRQTAVTVTVDALPPSSVGISVPAVTATNPPATASTLAPTTAATVTTAAVAAAAAAAATAAAAPILRPSS